MAAGPGSGPQSQEKSNQSEKCGRGRNETTKLRNMAVGRKMQPPGVESGWAVLEMRLWSIGLWVEESGHKWQIYGVRIRNREVSGRKVAVRTVKEASSGKSERLKEKMTGKSSWMVGERNVAANTEKRQRVGEMTSRVEKQGSGGTETGCAQGMVLSRKGGQQWEKGS